MNALRMQLTNQGISHSKCRGIEMVNQVMNQDGEIVDEKCICKMESLLENETRRLSDK